MLTGLPGPADVPRPRQMGGVVIYLDIDGVLNPESVYRKRGTGPWIFGAPGHRLFEHAELLADLLEPYPQVRIVLSTSWVRVYRSVRKVTRKLPPRLRARVIGATYHSRMDPVEFAAAPRGMQVWADVRRRKPQAWLALDDEHEGWPTWCRDHLVRTDPVLGISEPSVLEELKTKLEAMSRERGC